MGLSLLVVLVWVGVTVAGLRSGHRTIRPRPSPPKTRDLLDVTWFTPARNEVEVIEACVAGARAQAVARYVFVDDHSTDGTGARLHASGMPPLQPPAPAPGQLGKPSALAFAVARAAPDTEWLLFVDADVLMAPGAVSALVERAERSGWDLVSAHPHQVMKTWVEQVVLPSVGSLVLLAHPPHRVSAERPFANGQCLMVRRESYLAAGGHAAVAGEVLEDLHLAAAVARAGGRLGCVDGRDLARTRMYASWSELREGFAKNLFELLGGRWSLVAPRLTVALLLGWAGPIAAAAEGPPGFVAWGAIASMQAGLRYWAGAPVLASVWAPIGVLAAAWLAVKSGLSRGRVEWKGRHYG